MLQSLRQKACRRRACQWRQDCRTDTALWIRNRCDRIEPVDSAITDPGSNYNQGRGRKPRWWMPAYRQPPRYRAGFDTFNHVLVVSQRVLVAGDEPAGGRAVLPARAFAPDLPGVHQDGRTELPLLIKLG
jgi:hypothetical protein